MLDKYGEWPMYGEETLDTMYSAYNVIHEVDGSEVDGLTKTSFRRGRYFL